MIYNGSWHIFKRRTNIIPVMLYKISFLSKFWLQKCWLNKFLVMYPVSIPFPLKVAKRHLTNNRKLSEVITANINLAWVFSSGHRGLSPQVSSNRTSNWESGQSKPWYNNWKYWYEVLNRNPTMEILVTTVISLFSHFSGHKLDSQPDFLLIWKGTVVNNWTYMNKQTCPVQINIRHIICSIRTTQFRHPST